MDNLNKTIILQYKLAQEVVILDKGLYHSKNYDHKARFISYYNQFQLTMKLNPKTVLEIGVGNHIFEDILKRYGVKVYTADLEKQLKPDYIIDLTTEFKLPKNKFDVICCFQTLEHIPYENVLGALKGFYKYTKKYAVISVPVLYFDADFRPSKLQSNFFAKQTYNMVFGTEHKWELNNAKIKRKDLVNTIKEAGFKIRKEFVDNDNRYHYFFVLEK